MSPFFPAHLGHGIFGDFLVTFWLLFPGRKFLTFWSLFGEFFRFGDFGRDFGALAAFLVPLVAIFGICAQNDAERWHRERPAWSLGSLSRESEILEAIPALRWRFCALSWSFSESAEKMMQKDGIDSVWRPVWARFPRGQKM